MMEISGLFIRGLLTGVLGPSLRPDSPERPQDTLPPPSTSSTALIGTLLSTDEARLSIARQILEIYDVTHITPRQFSEMLHRMREAGLISEGEFHELAKIQADLKEAGVEPDEAVDLLSFYRQRLRRIALWGEARDDASLEAVKAAWEKQLQWLEKVAAARENGAVSLLAVSSPSTSLDQTV